jgi:hypothetical protein
MCKNVQKASVDTKEPVVDKMEQEGSGRLSNPMALPMEGLPSKIRVSAAFVVFLRPQSAAG